MDIKSDKLVVPGGSVYTADGERLEPEEKPVQRVLEVDAPIALDRSGPTNMVMPGVVVQETTASAVATALRHRCELCRNFDRSAFRKYLDGLRGSAAGLHEINQIMGMLTAMRDPGVYDAHRGADGEFDSYAALEALGICRVLTEIHKEAVVVHPLSCCPTEVCSTTCPEGLFVPIDTEADRRASAIFDEIMLAASKK